MVLLSTTIFFLTPIDEPIGPGDERIIQKIKHSNMFAVITKLDKGDAQKAKEKAMWLKKKYGFKEVVGTSVEIKNSIDQIIIWLKEKLPEGIPFYDVDEITDKTIGFLAKESIRESTIDQVRDEVPHSIGIQITEITDEKEIYKVRATIFVERESQKGIIVGKEGKTIKIIGTESREKIERIVEKKVFLDLRVKVNKNWTNDEIQIKKMGY